MYGAPQNFEPGPKNNRAEALFGPGPQVSMLSRARSIVKRAKNIFSPLLKRMTTRPRNPSKRFR
jgi:hypothetical protein